MRVSPGSTSSASKHLAWIVLLDDDCGAVDLGAGSREQDPVMGPVLHGDVHQSGGPLGASQGVGQRTARLVGGGERDHAQQPVRAVRSLHLLEDRVVTLDGDVGGRDSSGGVDASGDPQDKSGSKGYRTDRAGSSAGCSAESDPVADFADRVTPCP